MFLAKIPQRYFFIIITVLGFIVYGNTFFNGFVWDDNDTVVNNSLIRSLENIPLFFRGSTFDSGGQLSLSGVYYKPLITVIFSLIYSLSGQHVFLYHLLQISIHIANTLLVYFLFTYFFRRYIAFFLSLVLLVHPMNVEAVSYISSVEDPLFVFFGLLSTLVVMYKKLTVKTAIVVSVLLLLALLSKESGVLFIPITFLFLFLKKKPKILTYLMAVVPVVLIYCLLRFGIAQMFFLSAPVFPMPRLSLCERLLHIPAIFSFYMTTFFYPHKLRIAQDWIIDGINWQEFYFPLIISLIFLFLLGTAGVLLYKKRKEYFKGYLFFSTIFLVSLGIHLQIVPLDLTVAERWFYLTMIGLLGMFGVFLESIYSTSRKYIPLLLALVILSILALSMRTMVRNADWKNEKTLYSHDMQIGKPSYQIENNYGQVLWQEGKIAEAKQHFERSIELAPYRWASWINLGAAYEKEGNIEEAKKYYKSAIAKGNFHTAYENYARVLFVYGDAKEAQAFSLNAVTLFPLNADLWIFLALSEYKLGNSEAALHAAIKGYQLSPTKQSYMIYSRIKQGLPITVKNK